MTSPEQQLDEQAERVLNEYNLQTSRIEDVSPLALVRSAILDERRRCAEVVRACIEKPVPLCDALKYSPLVELEQIEQAILHPALQTNSTLDKE